MLGSHVLLATEAHVSTDKNTRKHAEDAAADQAKHGDSCSAKRVDTGPSMCLASFGDDSTEPPVLLRCRDDAMVDKGAAALKPYFSPVKMRMLAGTGGLIPAGTAFTATRTIFHQLHLWFCPAEEMSFRTSIQYTTKYYSSFWKVLETKAGQTLMFDPGGCAGRLRGCPFLGKRYAFPIGWACSDAARVAEAGAFLVHRRVDHF